MQSSSLRITNQAFPCLIHTHYKGTMLPPLRPPVMVPSGTESILGGHCFATVPLASSSSEYERHLDAHEDQHECQQPRHHRSHNMVPPNTFLLRVAALLCIFLLMPGPAFGADGPGTCPGGATGTNFTVSTQTELKNYVACSNANPSTPYYILVSQNIVFDEWWQTASPTSGVYDNAALHIKGTLYLEGASAGGNEVKISRSTSSTSVQRRFRL